MPRDERNMMTKIDLKDRRQREKHDDWVGPLRTHHTWKPRVVDTPLTFFRCADCGTIVMLQDTGAAIENPGSGRDRISILPYDMPKCIPHCCGKPMEVLPFVEYDEEVEKRFYLEHETVGGVNENGLRIHWETFEEGCVPRWITIKTFTGHQTKYITPDKKSPVIFALADEDAFTYCHDNPCRECVFRCKSGFEIYVYVENIGIVHMDMNRILTQKMIGA